MRSPPLSSPFSSNINHANTDAYIQAWREGIRLFNQGRYFQAHEAWEWGWTRLPEPSKTSIQATIQGAAVFVLLFKGRRRAASALARSSLQKFSSIRGAAHGLRVEVSGLQKLLRICAEGREDPDRILTKARALRAYLRAPS